MKPKTPELLKFKRLSRHLGEGIRGTAGLLELLWVGTAKNCPEGDIGKFSNEEIAVMCDWGGDADKLVAALIETRWLDACDTHRLLVHDWPEHAPDYIRGNLKRWGKEFAKAACLSNTESSVPSSVPCEVTSLPVPALPSPPPPQPDPAEPEWAEAEAALTDAGVGTARDCIEHARKRGCLPVDVRRVLAHWRSKQPAWSEGAIVHRLESLRHEQDPADPRLWPPPSNAAKAVESSHDRIEAAVKAANAIAEGDERRAAAKAESGRLNAEHGASVDALSLAEIAAIMDPRVPGWRNVMRIPGKGRDPTGALRDALLSHFDSQTARAP